MEILKVEESLDKIEVSLYKYNDIMNRLYNTDVSKDIEFQKMFNGFYRIRQRKPEFYQCYYELLEKSKGTDIPFEEVLTYIFNHLGRMEASFSSKLVATINTDMPVWDTFVLKNLGLKPPYQADKDRLNKLIILYEKMCIWYNEYLKTDEAKQILDLFNSRYSDVQISDVKKIDLILWQTR